MTGELQKKVELPVVSRTTSRWRSEDTEVEIVAEFAYDLPDFGSEWTAISTSVDQFGQLVLLLLDGEPDYVLSAGPQGTIPKLRSRRLNQFQVVQIRSDGIVRIDLPPTYENYHFAQPLSQGRWIAVRGRCEGVHDANAHIFNPPAGKISSFHVGDGVNDVCVSPDDTIWISYFDEGIYGPTQLAQEGLVGMDTDGQVVFRYTDCLTVGGINRIADCTAINVAEDGSVWVYYYTDFPLVNLRDPKLVRAWGELPVEFAESFAVENLKALFTGGYDNRELLHLLDLERHRHWPAKVLDSDGNMLPFEASLGRGALLYLLNGRRLYTVDCRKLTLAQ